MPTLRYLVSIYMNNEESIPFDDDEAIESQEKYDEILIEVDDHIAKTDVNTEKLLHLLDGLERIKDTENQQKLQEQLKKTYRSRSETLNGIQYCQNTVSEFLQDYLIVGHTYSGERVKVQVAKSKKDQDSLRSAARDCFINMMMSEQQDEID